VAAPDVFAQILNYANRPNPYPLYAELRKTPVARQADGSYVVSTYREIEELLHDPRISSDRRTGAGAQEAGAAAEEAEEVLGGFIATDPPEHDRLRRLAMRQFGPPHTPDRIDAMQPELVEIVTHLIDAFDGKTQVDLVDDFAYPFPVTVICRLLGVPREDEPRFHVWADAIVEAIGARGENAAELRRQSDQAFAQLGQYLAGLADARSHEPGDDLLSGLVTDDGPEGRMSREELMGTAALLLFAGHETTVNLIANGMLTLLRHPDVLARLRREPEVAIRLVEELLRYEPPVQFLPNRYALDDVEIAGTTIPAGSQIILVLASGSRDPEHVRDPDRFNPDRFDPDRFGLARDDDQHLGFGGGIHYCFGAPLARLEAQIALSELARRLEHPRLLADPPPYRPNPVLRGPRHLPIEFDQVAPAKQTATTRRNEPEKQPSVQGG
jgi:cytochrome P450